MTAYLDVFRSRSREMLEALEALVSVESPSSDLEATARCAREVQAVTFAITGKEPRLEQRDGHTIVRLVFGPRPRVLLLGHLDTVWPMGTAERWPFEVRDGVATGPGAFDMKAGIVQGLFAVAALDDPCGVEMMITSDEETGSRSSRPAIEDAARRVDAVLVLEPSAGGALKTGRKGVSAYAIEAIGRAAHAGLEPHRGLNALVEMAHQVRAVDALARPERGTTVTPTLAAAGTAVNTVPARATLHVDVRAASPEEQSRVEAEMKALRPVLDGARLVVSGGPNRPPLPASASAALFERAQRLAASLGLGPLEGCEVGGGSDGNFTAGVGTPTLDGLGPVGDGAHAEGEHVLVAAMPERSALVASLTADLLSS